jgi:tetratricopeptide (TPR) repeat protein
MKFFMTNLVIVRLVIGICIFGGVTSFLENLTPIMNAQEKQNTLTDTTAETLLEDGIKKSGILIGSEGRYSNSSERNYEGAMSALTQAIKLDPNLSQAYYYRGLLQSEYNAESRAIQDLAQSLRSQTSSGFLQSDLLRVLEVEPKSANGFYDRALVRLELYDAWGAFRDINQAIRLDPSLAVLYYSRAKIYGASNFLLNSQTEQSNDLSREQKTAKILVNDYTKAIKINPTFADVYNYRAQAYETLGNRQAAIQDWNQVIQLNPRIANIYFSRGSLRYRSGDKKGSEDDYLLYLRYAHDARLLFGGMPWCARRISECSPEAVEEIPDQYSQLIKQNPKDFLSYYRRGKTYYRLKQYLEASNDLKEVIRLTKNTTQQQLDDISEVFFSAKLYHRQAYLTLALVSYDMKDFKSAIVASTQAIQLDPASQENFLIRGRIREAMGDQNGAKQDYAKIKDLFCLRCGGPPLGNGEKFYRQGIFIRQKGDRKGALKYFLQAATLFRVAGEVRRYEDCQKMIRQLTP